MIYELALELKNRNLHLIGQTFDGEEIDDLVIAPINPQEWDRFIGVYLLNGFDGSLAIESFIQSDLGVVAIFGRDYVDDGFFFFESIHNLRPFVIIK